MTVQAAYDFWAANYDADANKTRDIDEEMTRDALSQLTVGPILEIGCGTGKNTGLLAKIGERVHGLDFSAEMLAKARAKIKHPNVTFDTADLTRRWPVDEESFELIACNLVLEHIENLDHIFAEAARVLRPGGRFYVSEFHPFKQYDGKAARFEKDGETVKVPFFVHHITDFIESAEKAGLSLQRLREGWHATDRGKPPRIVTFLFVN